jgi:hypothetical protein
MLHEVHSALQRLLYERGQISAREVDIQFERPTRERIDKLIRPTINLFLFDLQENIELRQNDFRTRSSNRRAERYLPPRYFDLRYMVSILTSAIEDEHLLLWRVLTTLVRHPQFPPDLLPEELHTPDHFLTSKVSQDDDGERLSNIWNALGVSPRPALSYILTVPVDMDQVVEAPLVLSRTVRYTNMHESEKEIETVTSPKLTSNAIRKEDSTSMEKQ